jgi:hypothetical protein
LGHEISQKGVRADPQRIAAIQNYPAPRNQKQLHQFLGICNFYHRFIVNYASFVDPLLPLLKKKEVDGNGMRKRRQLSKTYEHSILLVHPDDDSPFIVHTDASKIALGALLLQTVATGRHVSFPLGGESCLPLNKSTRSVNRNG